MKNTFTMKTFLMIAAISGALFSGCKSTGALSGTDDVYANPAEERRLAQMAREEQARKEALARQGTSEQYNVQDDNNPYYKDPEYNADDYYDYEYASRINRFHNPLPGTGYYDPYYTNMYSYNQNPAFYGTSIYSGWGMPSASFGMYSMGISSGWGYNPGMRMGMGWGMGYGSCFNSWGYNMYSYYDPFCYRPGFYDPWGYSSFGAGYNMGYYNGFYNGMYASQYGYYNRYDPNSNYKQVNYGPRGSSSGGNSVRGAGATRATESSSVRRQYMESVASEQEKNPRFTERRSTSSRRAYNSANPPGSTNQQQGRISQPQNENAPARTPDRRSQSRRATEGTPQQQQPRQQQQQQRQQQQTPGRNSTWSPSPSNSGGSGRSGGGMSSPRGSGSGGSGSPRR